MDIQLNFLKIILVSKLIQLYIGTGYAFYEDNVFIVDLAQVSLFGP